MSRNYANKIARNLQVNPQQVAATIGLLDTDNTVPFIARYRKEVTGGLDEEQIRLTMEFLNRFRKVDDRRDSIVATLKEQENLTPQLATRIEAAETLTELEDLYAPFKQKRKTRATAAKEQGLQPLADLIIKQTGSTRSLNEVAEAYLDENVANPTEAYAGARGIIAEMIADHPDVRRLVRIKANDWGSLRSKKIKKALDERGTFETYYDFNFSVNRVRPHQVLAINRGEAEKVLRVKVEIPERDWLDVIAEFFPQRRNSPFAGQLREAIEDSASRLLLPSIERDIRRQLNEQAEDHAIRVFADNLRGLLNQPPLANQIVMGIDPGFRTGCKVAVVDQTGKVLDTATIYPHPPQRHEREAESVLQEMILNQGVNLLAIGNGTASRETEALVARIIQNNQRPLHYIVVNEAGASVYSASKLARAELPDMDVSMRGAVSIGRRVQDPLAELVKIDPQSIGVGMYQHDVNQKQLSNTLDAVVESVVNQVGVDVNTASPALLTRVAGIGPKLADAIFAYREKVGPFSSRTAIKKVPGLGPKAFEQAAGFLRIRDGKNPLDAGAIHPESYATVKAILQAAGLTPKASPQQVEAGLNQLRADGGLKELAIRFEIGELTLQDIFEQLVRPGRDPRQDLPAPILRSDVLSMDDLVTGMTLQGTVRNVVDFGAFIDIGVKQDGLLHRSKMAVGQQLTVGDVIEVTILNVDKERGRIGLG